MGRIRTTFVGIAAGALSLIAPGAADAAISREMWAQFNMVYAFNLRPDAACQAYAARADAIVRNSSLSTVDMQAQLKALWAEAKPCLAPPQPRSAAREAPRLLPRTGSTVVAAAPPRGAAPAAAGSAPERAALPATTAATPPPPKPPATATASLPAPKPAASTPAPPAARPVWPAAGNDLAANNPGLTVAELAALTARSARPPPAAAPRPAERVAPSSAERVARANPPRGAEPAAAALPKVVDLRNTVRAALRQSLHKDVHEPAVSPKPAAPAPAKWWKRGAVGLGFLTLAVTVALGWWLRRRWRSRGAGTRAPAEVDDEPRYATATR